MMIIIPPATMIIIFFALDNGARQLHVAMTWKNKSKSLKRKRTWVARGGSTQNPQRLNPLTSTTPNQPHVRPSPIAPCKEDQAQDLPTLEGCISGRHVEWFYIPGYACDRNGRLQQSCTQFLILRKKYAWKSLTAFSKKSREALDIYQNAL